MEFGQLHHVEYYVNDLKKTVELWGWFLSEMGYSEFQKWESGISWVHTNGTYLVFVQVETEFLRFTNNRQASGLNHICFKGKSSEHLIRLVEGLKNRSARILLQREDRICFEDSNLFAVEVYL